MHAEREPEPDNTPDQQLLEHVLLASPPPPKLTCQKDTGPLSPVTLLLTNIRQRDARRPRHAIAEMSGEKKSQPQNILNELAQQHAWSTTYSDQCPGSHCHPPKWGQETSEELQRHQWYKTRRCEEMEKGFFESGCPRGNKCFFAHSEEELRTKPAEEYRYTLTLEMPNGVKCFANVTAKDSAVEAKAELATQALRDAYMLGYSLQKKDTDESCDDKYKTVLCTRFSSGQCTFGSDCWFAHGASDQRSRAAVGKNTVCSAQQLWPNQIAKARQVCAGLVEDQRLASLLQKTGTGPTSEAIAVLGARFGQVAPDLMRKIKARYNGFRSFAEQHLSDQLNIAAADTRKSDPPTPESAEEYDRSQLEPDEASAPEPSGVSSHSNIDTDSVDDTQLQCPITKQRFIDPVLATDGHTYERDAIERWLANHDTSPVTEELLPSKQLAPNQNLYWMLQLTMPDASPLSTVDDTATEPLSSQLETQLEALLAGCNLSEKSAKALSWCNAVGLDSLEELVEVEMEVEFVEKLDLKAAKEKLLLKRLREVGSFGDDGAGA